MRLQAFLGAAISFAALVLSASATGETTEPEVAVTANFPESNHFGHVVNGEKNSLLISVENKSGRNVTLVSVAGSVHHSESNRLVKNLTSTKFGIPLLEGVKLEVPYAFYSEFKPGDLRLTVWLEHSVDGSKYRVSAYDSVITIVEPELSILDFKLISTYLMIAAIFGGLTYFAYLTYFPQSKKSRTKKTAASVSAPVGSVTATGAGGYQEEWIPEHHLKKSKKGASGATGGLSGDEVTGSELSGSESRKRKGKK
ncbi:Increased recombination centers protein 22 [Hypsizygus marmoreus]|uniref:Increased recombination centers protein 22 n=1 Tax=Hypsizygus marmoreus TaxID=39966 RepID=A0A369K664_HYPMA|nr:Increased recombination centers protein 22 [Hypsizygus marmoreus]